MKKTLLALLALTSVGVYAQDLTLTCDQGYSAVVTNLTSMNPSAGKITVMKGDEG